MKKPAEKKLIAKITLSSLSKPELLDKADKLRAEIAKSRMEIKIKREKNLHKAKNQKKNLAQVLSVLMLK